MSEVTTNSTDLTASLSNPDQPSLTHTDTQQLPALSEPGITSEPLLNLENATKEQCEPQVPSIPGLDEKNHICSILARAETEFNEFIKEIKDDKLLSKFCIELEKLFRSLKKSVSSGINVFEQYTTLHQKYNENLNNNQTVSKSASQDETTIKSLKGQIKRSAEFIETSRLKEEKAKDELRQLRIEANDLKSTLTQGVGLSSTQERTINNLMQMKEESLRDLETETGRIAHLRSRIADVVEKTRLVDLEKRALETESLGLKERIAARKLQIDAETRIRDNLESDLRDTRLVVSVKSTEVKEKQESVNQVQDDIALLQNQVKSQKQMLDKSNRDYEHLVAKVAKYKEECDAQITSTNAFVEHNNGLLNVLQKKEAELEKVSQTLIKTNKIRTGLQKKIRLLESKKNDAESQMRSFEDESASVLEKIEQFRLDTDHAKKVVEDLTREQNILQNNMKKLQTSTETDQHALLLLQQTRTNMEQEQQQCIRLVQKRQAELLELEETKARYTADISDQRIELETMHNAIKEKDAHVYQQKKSAVEQETRLKHQRNVYETAVADRNAHAHASIESLKEISDAKRQLKTMTFSISGLKEKLAFKQDELTRELANSERLARDMEVVNKNIKGIHHKIDLSQTYAKHQVTEENNLSQNLQDAELEKQRQEHSLAVAISERDRLSEQITKQDDELLKVYNDIKTNQFALLRSQKHYLQKKQQRTEFKTRVRHLAQEQRIIKLKTRDFDPLKQAMHQLKAELLGEQSHIKLLSDQLNIPVNIHRWRKLEGSDPVILETIQLSQSLQRAIIDKSTESAAKEAEICEREQAYMQLKELQSRQVGVEALEQVVDLNRTIKEKHMNLKHMQTEVDMYRAQIKEYKYNLSGLDRQLIELKALYFEQKRFEARDAESRKAIKHDGRTSTKFNSMRGLDDIQSNKNVAKHETLIDFNESRPIFTPVPNKTELDTVDLVPTHSSKQQVVELPPIPKNPSTVSIDLLNNPDSSLPVNMIE